MGGRFIHFYASKVKLTGFIRQTQTLPLTPAGVNHSDLGW